MIKIISLSTDYRRISKIDRDKKKEGKHHFNEKRSSIFNKYFRNEFKMETNKTYETVLKSSLKIGKGVSLERLS